MKAEYANPFFHAAVNVFQQEVGIKLSRTDLSKKRSAAPSHPISIIIGVTGAIKGQVVYSMDGNFAFVYDPGKSPVCFTKVSIAFSDLHEFMLGFSDQGWPPVYFRNGDQSL